MHIPELITDLAIMLITAGVITVIFKKIKQPLVLGYILAGFLISPFFPFFPTVVDTASISTWSEIGIIFLMFHLGLEFNIHKLAEIGSVALIATTVEVIGVTIAGFFIGQMLGFGTMNSICLGGMLSMSSTTIVIKAFDEMGLTKKKYAELSFGTLIIQDIVGIFMMVILSTISVSQNVSGIEVAKSLSMMILYLIIWLVLGIYFLPTILNKSVKFMNDEMLLVASLGICFGMVLLANYLGFSTALGAFLSGSLLAGTNHRERIEHLTVGVKDLFGAVFFLSVGMMVDPAALTKYWIPILVITVGTIIAKVIFMTLGMILSGQDMENSIMSGFSLAQIGEFAFIIASLGMNLGVTADYLYPIVVSVSVITTFTTPFSIKLGPKFISLTEKILPESLKEKINNYTSETRSESKNDKAWYDYIKSNFIRLLVFGGLMFLATVVGIYVLQPALKAYLDVKGSKVVALLISYILIGIFIAPLMNLNSDLYTALWLKNKTNRLPLMVMNCIKVFVIAFLMILPIWRMFGVRPYFMIILIIAVIIFFAKTGAMGSWYLQIETRFLQNLNERIINKEESEGGKQTWLNEKLCIISFIAESGHDYVGKTLKDLEWGKKYNVYIVKAKKGNHTILLPKENTVIEAGTKLFAVGEKRALENLYKLIDQKPTKKIRTLAEFMESGYPDIEKAIAVAPIKVTGKEPFANKPIISGNFRKRWNCVIIGVQRGGLPVIMPNSNMVISKDDIIWVVGSNNNVGTLATEYTEE